MPRKRSFFDKLTGNFSYDHDEETPEELKLTPRENSWMEEEALEGQLTVDVYQNSDEVIVKTMVAGVKPEDLSISISRTMVTIKGRREEERGMIQEDYFFKELYWGSFSRTILLPEEVDPEGAQAVERHGLLTIRIPRLDKERTQQVKVKSG